jgi:hypothetical protein
LHPVGVLAESRAARAEISAEHDDIYRLDVLCMMQKPFQVLIIPMEVAAEQHADAHLCVSGVGTAAKKASSVMISKPGRRKLTRPRKKRVETRARHSTSAHQLDAGRAQSPGRDLFFRPFLSRESESAFGPRRRRCRRSSSCSR